MAGAWPPLARSRMACAAGGAAPAAAGFQESLRRGEPKLGVFLNSASPLVAEQLSNCGYDWLLASSLPPKASTTT